MKNRLKKLLLYYRNTPIKKKLPMIFTVQIVIPLLLIGAISYFISERIITNQSINYTRNLLNMVEFNIKDYMDKLWVISQDVLYEKQLYTVLNSDKVNQSPLFYYENSNEINNILKKVLLSRNEISSIYVISSAKNYYICDDGKYERAKNVPYDAIIEKARAKNGKLVWYLESKDNKVENIFVARTIYNQDKFNEMGILIIQAEKKYFENLCAGLINKDIQNITIVNDENEEIISSDSEKKNVVEKSFLQSIKNKSGSAIDKKSNYLINYTSMPSTDWNILTFTSLKSLYSDIETLRLWIIILSLISIAILIFFNIFTAADLIDPIKKLVVAMNHINNDDELVTVTLDREDEFGILSKNFNKMVEKINYLVKWVYKEELTRKEAQLKALQAQINPHFLFNTLESINWMAQLRQAPEISEMVTSLSYILDAGIGRDDKMVTILDEKNYINHYILILKKRFGDKINFITSVSKSVEDILIPKLLIQPIIENAIYHGIDKNRGKGYIYLKIDCDDDIVFIEVVDNGAGLEPAKLEKINELLDNEANNLSLDGNEHNSIGLTNTNKRIKLFFGTNYGVKIYSKYPYYTKVILKFPRKGGANDV